MIKIFNEKAYIDNYIKDGFRNLRKWGFDAKLYVRWLKLPMEDGGRGEEFSKAQCKEELLRKLKKNQFFNLSKSYQYINDLIEQAWKDKTPLLDIKTIPVSYATMNWFKMQGLKKNEIKLLFTLYLGYLIKQHKYAKEYCKVFDLFIDREFLRTNSNIAKGYSIRNAIGVFADKGLIHYPGHKITLTFIDREDFKECENDISDIYNFSLEELDNIGNTLFTYYEQHRFCLACGKLIPEHPNKKYCDECYEQRNREKAKERYEQQEEKTLICEQCGKEFTISANGKRKKCEQCYKDFCKERDRLRKQSERNALK